MSNRNYIFKSERLGFRNWADSDKVAMAQINADVEVMKHFPNAQNTKQTEAFIHRMQQQYVDKGFCYFAVDKLEDNQFIGFIGLSEQNFESHFTPCIDIGWRISKSEWGKGFATEGAKRCLEFAFQKIGLQKIKAICPKVNIDSENVMKKIGMLQKETFKHPLLKDFKHLEECVLYEIEKPLSQ